MDHLGRNGIKNYEIEIEKLYDIVAFIVPHHRSIIYKMFQTREQLILAVQEATDKGANVISIREALFLYPI